jgi:hypothetical protein
MYTIMMPFWADDISGARSKQYQKHINVYAFNANLPSWLLSQEFHVRFISTSPFAGALEQLESVVQSITSSLVEPIQTWDAFTQKPCSFRLLIPDMPADNPQQSEEASHMGHQAKCKCRDCLVGGEAGFDVTTVDSYGNLYRPGPPRDVVTIKKSVEEQIRVATKGIATAVADLQTKSGTKDKIAQYWIERLIEMAREEAKNHPSKTTEQITTELLEWLKGQTKRPYNPLLDVPGM